MRSDLVRAAMWRMRTVGRIAGAIALAACAINCGSDGDAVDEAGSEVNAGGDVFDGDAPVGGIGLTADFAKLEKRDQDGAMIPDASDDNATLVAPSLGITTPIAVTVSVRGNTSVIQDECSFPKLKVKVKDKALLQGTSLKGHSTLRIATHCGELKTTERTPIGRVANEIAPWREAFGYQLLRATGLEAPKSRPLTITYVDSGRSNAKLERKAALIETAGDVADRLGGKEAFIVDSEISADEPEAADPADPEHMDRNEVVRVQLAEALVGNADFRLNRTIEKWWMTKDSPQPVTKMWNMKAVRMPDGKERPVPVDLDLSAIVAPATFAPAYAGRWGAGTADTQNQFAIMMATRTRFSRAELDAARSALATKETAVNAVLARTWIDAEAKNVATKLVGSFFSLMKIDRDFYVDVVAATNARYVRADGTPDDRCLDNRLPAGTPIHRFGRTNEALGIEEVSLLEVKAQLPCNEDRVWIKKGTAVTGSFPR